MSYLPGPYPERGRSDACPHCGIKQANQHSLRESGLCDFKRKHPGVTPTEEISGTSNGL